ncbi:Transposon Tf2-9 polyprotein [Nosema granulosis]|uniref:Transposon Tf2-9 polyprotein n=1 Tax=Nosema granulosis TaxID=83296 RepID=A0A9P6GVP3_9MICR|nr:Transposon Tf2-9 polyprotein [Nosema granulosis]
MDLVGSLPTSRSGHKYLLTIVDHYSKVADVIPLRSKDSFEVTESILRTIYKMGIPKIILSDNGTEFKNEKLRRICQENKIELRNGAPYTPTTTGGIERFNRTFMEKLRKVTDFGCTDWVEGIKPALQGYLNSFHRGIGCTPIECWNETKKRKIKEHVKKYRETYGTESKTIFNKLVVGDMVLYHNPLGRSNKLEADYNDVEKFYILLLGLLMLNLKTVER